MLRGRDRRNIGEVRHLGDYRDRVRLVGRESALAEIDSALKVLSAGLSGALALSGEPGIGKTRLLAELAARADARGYLVLEGRAAEFERNTPFAVFVDALDDYLAGVGPRALALLPAATVAHLAAVFPAVPAPIHEPVTVLQAERYRIHRAVRSLLDALGVTAPPLLLILDDLHWADEASAELFAHLLTHPPSRRVLIATAYRPSQLGDRARVALERGEVQAIDVTPLSRADAERLLGGAVRRDAMDALYAESGGNPFYLLELARQRRVPAAGSQRDGDIPPAVLAAINREIAELSAEARVLAQGGAVAGEPFLLDAAAIAASTTTDAALSVIDLLLTGGLVVHTDVPRRFRFRHPVVRRAVYESAGTGWRIGAHRRLAAALREHGASPVELAHHVAAAAEPGDTDAVDVLAAAGHALSPQAPAIAADRFAAALRLLPGDAHGRRLDLLVPLATSLGAAGQLHASRSAWVEALSLLPLDATAQRVKLTTFCGGVEHLLGMTAEAYTRLCDALRRLPDRTSPEAAALLVELAINAGLYRADFDDFLAYANEARSVARQVGAHAMEATALALLGMGEYHAGRYDQASSALDEAARLLDDVPDSELAGHLAAAFYVSRPEFFLDRYAAAVRHADRGLALARATGATQFLVPLLSARSAPLRNLGRLREASETAQEAVDAARLTGNDQALLTALIDRIWLVTANGDLPLALALGEEALAMAHRLPATPETSVAGWAMAEALLESGQPGRAAVLLLEPRGRAEIDSAILPGRCLAWQLLARAEVDRSRLDQAEQWIERIDAALPKLVGLSTPSCWGKRARAHLLLARGDYDGAARAALAAAEAADRVSYRVEASRGRLLAGRALGKTPERERAIGLLEQARAEFQEYGARRYHDQAVQELRRLGKRIGRGGRRAAGDEGLEALSEREQEIAALVTEGRTNKEIGDTLLISTRTVERHLSHIFGKLGVSSRAQLGSVVERALR